MLNQMFRVIVHLISDDFPECCLDNKLTTLS